MTLSTAIAIRPARPEDLDAILAITEQVFEPYAMEGHIARTLGASGGASWLEVKAHDLRRELASWPDACFIAELGGRIAGYATCTVNPPAARGTIANLAVAADCQGRGVGRALLLRCLQRFRELGLRQAKIETLECNEVGRHLYTSMGFREAGRQIHYVMPLR